MTIVSSGSRSPFLMSPSLGMLMPNGILAGAACWMPSSDQRPIAKQSTLLGADFNRLEFLAKSVKTCVHVPLPLRHDCPRTRRLLDPDELEHLVRHAETMRLRKPLKIENAHQ